MTTQPVRIQRTRKKGSNLRAQSLAINGLEVQYVGRGSRWGNPFRIEQYKDGKWRVRSDGSIICVKIAARFSKLNYETKADAAKDAVDCYNGWINYMMAANPDDFNINQVQGKNLSCWCRDGEICHADVLLKLANS